MQIISLLKKKHEEFGIKSEWLFLNKEGELLKKRGYFDFNTVLQKKFKAKASTDFSLLAAGLPKN